MTEPLAPPRLTASDLACSPTIRNAMTLASYAGLDHPELDVAQCVALLRKQAAAIQAGDLTGPEATLAAQAAALDAIFTSLSRRALRFGHMDTLERYLKLALKAQSQCRATLETLAEMKNPGTVAIVRQANIGQAVQVNNAPPARGKKVPVCNNPMDDT